MFVTNSGVHLDKSGKENNVVQLLNNELKSSTKKINYFDISGIDSKDLQELNNELIFFKL